MALRCRQPRQPPMQRFLQSACEHGTHERRRSHTPELLDCPALTIISKRLVPASMVLIPPNPFFFRWFWQVVLAVNCKMLHGSTSATHGSTRIQLSGCSAAQRSTDRSVAAACGPGLAEAQQIIDASQSQRWRVVQCLYRAARPCDILMTLGSAARLATASQKLAHCEQQLREIRLWVLQQGLTLPHHMHLANTGTSWPLHMDSMFRSMHVENSPGDRPGTPCLELQDALQ